MDDTLESLPFTPTGISVIGALMLVIVYLFRLNAVDRRDHATRLSTLESEAAARLRREEHERDRERAWLREFYETRLQKITDRYEEQLARCDQQTAALRSELQDVKAQLARRSHHE